MAAKMDGFIPVCTSDGSLPAWQKLPCGAITPKIGMALYMASNVLAIAGGEVPEYICMEEHSSAVTSGTLINVVKISKDQVYEAPLDGATSFDVGDFIDVASGGMKLDADASTDDAFQIEWLEAKTAGAAVRGRFVK